MHSRPGFANVLTPPESQVIIPTLTANSYEKDRKPLCTQADAVFLF